MQERRNPDRKSNRLDQRQKLEKDIPVRKARLKIVLMEARKSMINSSIHLKPRVQGRGLRDVGRSQGILGSLDSS